MQNNVGILDTVTDEFTTVATTGEAAAGSSDEQSRRAAAWQQKRTQEMMTLKRKNQTLEAGAEKLKQELATAHAEVKALEGKLEAEAAAAKARNSSTWRLRQENERLVKAEALRQQQQQQSWELRSASWKLGTETWMPVLLCGVLGTTTQRAARAASTRTYTG